MTRRRALWLAALGATGALALGIAGAGLVHASRLAGVGTAYLAKTLCSAVFVSRRDSEAVLNSDLSVDDLAVLRQVSVRVDRAAREVSADLYGFARHRSVFRGDAGCVLVRSGASEHADGAAPAGRPPETVSPKTVSKDDPFDATDPESVGFDRGRLDAAVAFAFAEPALAPQRRTRALVVVHKGRVVAERYADGFAADSPLLGWSMTKSVMNALVAILVREGKISLDDPVPAFEWRDAADPRHGITWRHLLHMNSGLQFGEEPENPLDDATTMLLAEPDMAGFAAAKPLVAAPGARWSYSSGTSNILARAIREVIGPERYPGFPRAELFRPLEMTGALLETDGAGTFVGSSYMYATARDWARFGLLYGQDGIWAGRRLLPQGWVDFTTAPAPGDPDRRYGAHFWLQVPQEYRCGAADRSETIGAFHAVGHEGQFVTIIPSRELVLVRLGLTRYPCSWDHQAFIDSVVGALKVGSP